jgi:hypothetical protein
MNNHPLRSLDTVHTEPLQLTNSHLITSDPSVHQTARLFQHAVWCIVHPWLNVMKRGLFKSYFSERWSPGLYNNSRKSMGRPNTWKVIFHSSECAWARGGANGQGAALQVRREFSLTYLVILLAALWPWGSTQPRTEMSNRDNSWE